jgi:hypothetical protein
VGRLFISQHGEFGAWRLGPGEWDGVEETRVSSGGIARNAVAVWPAGASTLVIALPPMAMQNSLGFTCGAPDGGARAPATVDVGVYVNGDRKSDLWCANTGGWKTFAVDTSAVGGRNADVVLLLTTSAEPGLRFAFRLDPLSKSAPASPRVIEDAGPIVLTGGHRLSDRVEGLRVHRLAGSRRIDAQGDGRMYTAAEMHEAVHPGVEGGLHRVWALGALPWDAVGSTRQRSNSEPRKGVWAHPRNGTTLVIEAPAVQVGGQLRAFFGFTDHSLRQASVTGVTAPVRFAVSMDGKTIIERTVDRTAGWTDISIPMAASTGERRVRIEISSASDSWAHFVFDLWSD